MTLGSGVILDLYGGVSGSTVWADHSIHGNDGVLDSADMRVQAPNDLEVMEFNTTPWKATVAASNSLTHKDTSWGIWFKTSLAAQQGLMQHGDGSLAATYSLIWYITAAGEQCLISSNGTTYTTLTGTATTLANGLWHFAAFTYTDSSGAVVFYLDGALDGSGVGKTGINQVTKGMWIGRDHVGNELEGMAYRPRAFTYLLSLPEVAEIHEQEELWFR